jgi:hypothetical protein
MTGVSRYDQSHHVDQNQEVRPKSGYTTEVISSDRSQEYNRSHVLRPESGIRPKSRLPTGVGHTIEVVHMTRVVIYLHYKHV